MIFLFTGKKHCGKTTALQNIVTLLKENNYKVAGFTAPSIYEGAFLLAFDLLDINTNQKIPFAKRPTPNSPFEFSQQAFDFGNKILTSKQTIAADLVIIDEFGPLEINRLGWRTSADNLINHHKKNTLLVVRNDSLEQTKAIYNEAETITIDFNDKNAYNKIIETLIKEQNNE